MAITAFPVLCRILTELNLLGTRVGVIVLSAGVGNDVVGWILLALCVALVNAGSGITALYVLLVCTAYLLFLGFVFRPLFFRFLERTGSLQKGPSQSVVTLTLLITLASAFFTQVIGVHAIFGGFAIGLVCPGGDFAIKLTSSIEDVVAALFLPLYFTLSGLSTNLGLLDSGLAWGYVCGVTAIAFLAKVLGGAVAARLSGLFWRESWSVGVLMSCKGLVELIVLVSLFLGAVILGAFFMLTGRITIEYWSSSQDPEHTNLHHLCCHGPGHNVPDDSTNHCPLPALVSGPRRAKQTRQRLLEARGSY